MDFRNLISSARPTIIDRPARIILPRRITPSVVPTTLEGAVIAEWSSAELTPSHPIRVPIAAFGEPVTVVQDPIELTVLLMEMAQP